MADTESLPCQDEHSSSSRKEETEPIKKLKKFRSIKLLRTPTKKYPVRRPKSRLRQYRIDESNPSPNYMKPTSCSDSRKEISQVSSESSSDYDISESSSRLNSAPADLHSVKTSTKKCIHIGEIQNSNVRRATCSSAFKTSKFPKQVEFHQPEGIELEEIPSMKVCPYTFCSLHGRRHHDPAPPLKQFVAQRRQLLRSQKSMKQRTRPLVKRNTSRDTRKGALVNKMIPKTKFCDKTLLEPDDLANMTDDLLRKSTIVISHDFKESNAVESIAFSHSVSDGFDEATAAMVEKRNSFEQDQKFGAPVHNQTTDLSDESHKEKEKHVSMWRLIHHSLSSAKIASQLRMDGGFDDTDTDKKRVQNIEQDAINLVKYAIDEILLPEVSDHSSYARSNTSDISSYEDFNEENNGNDGEKNLSMPKSCDRNRGREQEFVESDDKTGLERKNTIFTVENKSNQRIPKNWSKLKKLILFKRFIKALDKVRNLNFKETQNLSLEPDLGPERVNLGRKTAEERKRAEEWMLDYALRQVVCNLSPAHRRKVELLVEAFESVIADPGNGTHVWNKIAFSPRPKPNQALDDIIVQRCIDNAQENDSTDQSIIKRDKENFIFEKDNEEMISYSCYDDNVPISKILEKDESPTTVDQSPVRTKGLNKDSVQLSKSSKMVVPAASEQVNELKKDFPITEDNTLDKQKYMKMWRLIYQQVVSGSVEKFGCHDNLDSTVYKTEHVDDDHISRYSEDLYISKKITLSQIDAINMVEKAIDEVVLPEDEEYHKPSDDQSITSDVISDNFVVAKFTKFSQIKLYGETRPQGDIINPEQERSKQKINGKSNIQKPNGWSNLKKLILLNRFVKALDKVRELEKLREFKQMEPRYLSLEPDPEEERVNLRHQTMDDRKRAEEWMLDNAIQQVVARLTPTRKRRVELLVEAFETVTPSSENESTPWNSRTGHLWLQS